MAGAGLRGAGDEICGWGAECTVAGLAALQGFALASVWNMKFQQDNWL